MARDRSVPDVLLGRRLHGDDLDDAGLSAWLADEQDGYAGIIAAARTPSRARVPAAPTAFTRFAFSASVASPAA